MDSIRDASPVAVSEKMIEKSEFIHRYIKDMKKAIHLYDPNISNEEIEEAVKELLLKDALIPPVALDNNYTREYRESVLLSVLDWSFSRKPIIAGNGTFYKRQDESYNPAAIMLDGMLSKRKAIKNKLFSVSDILSRLYKDLDRSQVNQKINANSYYGGSGAKTSSFYSLYSGPATTLSAQSVISTTENLFESCLGDNYDFLDLDELTDWLTTVIQSTEKHEIDFTVLKPVSEDKLITRLIDKLMFSSEKDPELISSMVHHLPKELRSFIYYKNNMIEFIEDHPFIQELILNIFQSVKNLDYVNTSDGDWITKIPSEYIEEYRDKGPKSWNSFVNHKYFIDPNNPPEEIISYLKSLTDYFMSFVYVRYMAFDRIYRLKNIKRSTVTVIDTDSNILSLDTIVRYIIKKFFSEDRNEYSYGRSFLNNIFVTINMITYFITTAVQDILLTYGKYSNIHKDYRPRYNMKNEFMFAKLVIGESKKRYMSSVLLREGNIINPAKIDVKGFDFKKATCSEYAESVYMDIIKRRILNTESVDLQGMLNDIYAFRDEVEQSILSGDKRFLPNGNAKEIAGYKNPNSVQNVKAMLAWNYIHPDNLIEPPCKMSLLKMNIFSEEDILPLKETHPEIYGRIKKYIFEDETGMFVKKEWVPTGVYYVYSKNKEWYNEIPPRYRKEYKVKGQKAWNEFVANYPGKVEKTGEWKLTTSGLLILGIPTNGEIPDWTIPYIDIRTMVNNILAPFIPVIKIFKIKTLEEGKSHNGVNRKTESISHIIKF